MDLIKSIEINKIKGINNLKLELNMIANKPSIFIAPNGFGKSSITAAFNSITNKKLNVTKENFYNGKNYTDCFIKIIEIKNKKEIEYIVSNNENTFSKFYNVLVINNKVTTKVKILNINGNKFYISEKIIKDIILYKNIPPKINFEYSASSEKRTYKNNQYSVPILDVHSDKFINNFCNSKKYFENISSSKRISVSFKSFEEIIHKNKIPKKDFNNKFSNEELVNIIMKNSNVLNICKIFKETFDKMTDLQKIMYIVELLKLYKRNKTSLSSILKRKKYEKFKKTVEDIVNPIDNKKRIVKIKEEKNSLVAKMEKANRISNGEIDILCFLLILLQIKYKNFKKDTFLIIDEIFDYLDDTNIIIAQKYISMFIDIFKDNKIKIYPIIMTHLDPNVFKNFCFKDMKIYYLSSFNLNINDEFKKIIVERNKIDSEKISKYYLHYHPDTCDLSDEFKKAGLSEVFNDSKKFKEKIFEELNKYVQDKKADYLMVLCGLRVKLEEYLYFKLNNEHRMEFLNTNMTINKIQFSENNNIDVPENFKLLSILYNDFMHLDKKADPQNKKILFLSSKLNNLFIKKIIKQVFKTINQ